MIKYACCDLLENTYLCGSNNNEYGDIHIYVLVVICLKIRTFVVATTTVNILKINSSLL